MTNCPVFKDYYNSILYLGFRKIEYKSVKHISWQRNVTIIWFMISQLLSKQTIQIARRIIKFAKGNNSLVRNTTCIFVCLHTHILACLHSCMFCTCILAYLHTFTLFYLHTCILTYLQLDMLLLAFHSQHVTVDMSFSRCHSLYVTLYMSFSTCLCQADVEIMVYLGILDTRKFLGSQRILTKIKAILSRK